MRHRLDRPPSRREKIWKHQLSALAQVVEPALQGYGLPLVPANLAMVATGAAGFKDSAGAAADSGTGADSGAVRILQASFFL